MVFNDGFLTLLERSVGKENVSLFSGAMHQEPSVSVRLNAFKRTEAPLPILEGSSPVAWNPLGRILAQRPVFTLHPLFHAGAYYVQDSSAMFVAEAASHFFAKSSGQTFRVLDLCASPGGKTTDLSCRLREKFSDAFILVANEVMKLRASVLADNVARWGDPNVVVTNADPSAFAGLEGWFDLILADVPCSGEGMFRKDRQALGQWSEDNVKLCASRQRRIIADVWPALSRGGTLVYSTCTFNTCENDSNVKWICSELGASALEIPCMFDGPLKTETGWLLLPGRVPGEGQFVAAVEKESSCRNRVHKPGRTMGVCSIAPSSWFRGAMRQHMLSDKLIAVPLAISEDTDLLYGRFNVLQAGFTVAAVKGNKLVPDEDMALSTAFSQEAFPTADLDKHSALSFLHKDIIRLPGLPQGFITVRYKGLNLGFVKNLGDRCNNLHPASRRIRMDI